MNIKRIIKEELEGYKDSNEDDWGWVDEGVTYSVGEWLNEGEPYKFLVDLYDDENKENMFYLSGNLVNNVNDSRDVTKINELVEVLEIWPHSNYTAYDTSRKKGDSTKGLLVIEFVNGLPSEFKHRAKMEGKEWGDNVIILGKKFKDFTLNLSYEH